MNYRHKGFLILYTLFILATIFLLDVKLVRQKLFGMQVCVIGLGLFWLINILVEEKIEWKKNLLNISVFFYLLLVTIYYIFSPDKIIARDELQKLLLGAGIFFVTAHCLSSQNFQYLLKVWLISSFLIALYAIGQYFGWQFGPLKINQVSRPYASFGNPDFFAGFLIITLPLNFYHFLKKNRAQLFYFFNTLILLIALYFTKTRAAWLALSVEIIIFFVFYALKKGIFKKHPFLYWVFPLSIVLIGGIFGYLTRQVWLRPTERGLIWRDAFLMGLKNPLGVGIGGFHIYFPQYASEELLARIPSGQFIVNYAHNEYLDIFTETGWLGIGLFLWIIYNFIRYCLRGINKEKDFLLFIALLSSGCGILFQNIFSVSMRFIVCAVLFYLIAGIAIAQSNLEIRVIPLRMPANSGGKITLKATVLSLGLFGAIFFGRKAYVPLSAYKQYLQEEEFFSAQSQSEQILKLKELVKDGTQDYQVYYRLGWYYAQQKNWAEAINNFEKAVELNPQSAGAYNNLGNIYYLIGDISNAINSYQKSLEINPAQIDAHYNLGCVYFYNGQLKEAKDEFEIVLKLNPDYYKATIMLERMVQ